MVKFINYRDESLIYARKRHEGKWIFYMWLTSRHSIFKLFENQKNRRMLCTAVDFEN